MNLIRADLTPTLERFRRRVRNRFVAPSRRKHIRSNDPFVREVIRCYHNYYHEAMYEQRDAVEDRLHQTLIVAATKHGLHFADKTQGIEELENQILIPAFDSRGLHFLGGKTPPFFGPYIWRENHKRRYEIDLPESSISLDIVFMHGFIEQSWMSYITFDTYRAGGWATGDGIYCDYRSYATMLENDRFMDEFLIHEAQHVFDKRRYGLDDSLELELRAKLAQLIKGRQRKKLFKWFCRESADKPGHPHPYSSHLLVKAIGENETSPDVIRSRARLAYEASTERIAQHDS